MIDVNSEPTTHPDGRPVRVRRRAACPALLLAALAMSAAASAQDAAQPPLPTVELGVGIHRVVAEVARTPLQQQLGLMYRERMAPNASMLFVYEQPRP
ncbi:MAG: DUF192 domain-containing protein, partial [Rubrivivax sp.]